MTWRVPGPGLEHRPESAARAARNAADKPAVRGGRDNPHATGELARRRARLSARKARFVDEGRIRETAEVAEWIIAMRALRRIERERQARAE
jgi:hypothetical protein